jgi:hypothetical protein
MHLIGTEIAKMHAADIIHGDLTTSNMMLRHPSSLALGVRMELVSFTPFLLTFFLFPFSGLDRLRSLICFQFGRR